MFFTIYVISFLGYVLVTSWIPDILDDHGDSSGENEPYPPRRLGQSGGHPYPAKYVDESIPWSFRPKIVDRAHDGRPLDIEEMFPDGKYDDDLVGVGSTGSCSGAVWGARLKAELQKPKCSQVVRGLYRDSDDGTMEVVAFLNMVDFDSAKHLVKTLADREAGFVLPLVDDSGKRKSLFRPDHGEGYGYVTGHYATIVWLQRGADSPKSMEAHFVAEHLQEPLYDRASEG